METQVSSIDIKESSLHRSGSLLTTLLRDRTTGKNIIWGTDSYEERGKIFLAKNQVKPELITGKYQLLIQPRSLKSFEEQRRRTRDRAEVFTPLKTVELMNKALEIAPPTKDTWQSYIRELRLEITCGEAPFIVSRYNPTAHTGKLTPLANRVGFLDKKLKAVSKYCNNKKEWLFWAKEAFRASYGYEWQGDNILLARENLLYTFIDYYEAKFGKKPTLKMKEEFAEIVSWNIFQMDGLRYVIPMTCSNTVRPTSFTPAIVFPGSSIPVAEKNECEGCKYNRPLMHSGKYAKTMDWSQNKPIRFVDLIS